MRVGKACVFGRGKAIGGQISERQEESTDARRTSPLFQTNRRAGDESLSWSEAQEEIE